MGYWEVKEGRLETQEPELLFPFLILGGGEGQVTPLQGFPGKEEQVPE